MVKKWKNYWDGYKLFPSKSRTSSFGDSSRFSFSGINKWLIVFVVLIGVIITLSYFNFRTSNALKVLESNATSLQASLDDCGTEKTSLSSDLTSCNSNLDSCSSNLDAKTTSLNTCLTQKSTSESAKVACETDLDDLQTIYDSCVDDRNQYKSDFEDFQDFLDSQNLDDVNELEDEWNNLEEYKDDFGQMHKNYAENWCCDQGYDYYKLSSNKEDIICTNSSDDIDAGC